jgi:hypothetical protein
MGYSITDVYQFLSGAAMFGAWAGGVFFLKFWVETKERLFFLFALSFWIMAIERIVMIFIQNPSNEDRSLVYVIRLVAFLIIVYGILDKNRREIKKLT